MIETKAFPAAAPPRQRRLSRILFGERSLYFEPGVVPPGRKVPNGRAGATSPGGPGINDVSLSSGLPVTEGRVADAAGAAADCC